MKYLLSLALACIALTLGAQTQRLAAPDLSVILSRADLPGELADQLTLTRQQPQGSSTLSYYQQQCSGVPVFNALLTVVTAPDGRVQHVAHSLRPEACETAGEQAPALAAQQAIQLAAQLRGVPGSIDARRRGTVGGYERYEVAGRIWLLRLVHRPMASGAYGVAYEVQLDLDESAPLLFVDGRSGEVTYMTDLLMSCAFGEPQAGGHIHDASCTAASLRHIDRTLQTGTYEALPFELESPIYGDRAILDDPADDIASPAGWHTVPGEQTYTVTRGNNTFAYPDRDGDEVPDATLPDGGSALEFFYPFDQSEEPEAYIPAATTNLFYLNNIMHDWMWHYGFDEPSGNFQASNFTGEGLGSDAVQAHAQSKAGLPSYGGDAGITRNNADFLTRPDGEPGRMRMYIWRDRDADRRQVTILSPSTIAGSYDTGVAFFGPSLEQNEVQGELAIALPFLSCEPLTNPGEVAGRIAVVQRGDCSFVDKTLQAQAAGATACIICNTEEGIINLGGSPNADSVEIPVVMLSQADCNLILPEIQNGTVVAELRDVSESPNGVLHYDSDFDNGIIAHEYGHGVSIRLVGGPEVNTCLFNYFNEVERNGEQMGEGWSDFLGLALTANVGDSGEEARGIGNYVIRQDPDGGGIRPFPYSTDTSINPFTSRDRSETFVPHGIGTIWCTMLWEMYWGLVDEYGYDPDLYYGTGGNNIAVQLVMDGLKLTPCEPGFVDGRDAILAADRIRYGGANQEIIWRAFAKRGLGFSAEQGEPSNRFDGEAAFDMPPFEQEVLIEKTGSSLAARDGRITYDVTVTNFTDGPLSGITVTDELPVGTTLVGSPTDIDATQSGSELRFTVDLAARESVTLRFEVAVDSEPSRLLAYQGAEGNAEAVVISDTPLTEEPGWRQSPIFPYSGTYAWYAPNTLDNESRSMVVFPEGVRVEGTRPYLSFQHFYRTEPYRSAGVVEFSVDGGAYQDMEPYFIRNGYTGPYDVPGAEGRAFSGRAEGYINTVADLSDFVGQRISIRFTLLNSFFGAQDGWYIDDIALLDARTIENTACASAAGGAEYCSSFSEPGTLILPDDYAGTTNGTQAFEVVLAPNPVTSGGELQLFIRNVADVGTDIDVRLFSSVGELLLFNRYPKTGVLDRPIVSISDSVPPGVYFVMVEIDGERVTRKVVVRR